MLGDIIKSSSFFYLITLSLIFSGVAHANFLKGAVGEYQQSPLSSAAPTGEKTQKKKWIRSRITFRKGLDPHIHYGTIAMADPLRECPLETMPADLAKAADRLVVRVRSSATGVKQARGSQCSALDRRLGESRAQLGSAMQYHIMATNTLDTNNDLINRQNAINESTRQASAINGLVLATTDMLNRECIESVDAKIVIQRMLGQVVTLGGLFMGGWQGIGAAAGGQIIGSLPLFLDDVDRAIKAFQRYDEVNERGSFLCLFRQMQKTSCLMFSDPKQKIIDGLDTSLESGPGQITKESLDKVEHEKPELFHDTVLLWNLGMDSRPFLFAVEEKFFGATDSPLDLFHRYRKFCDQVKIDEFQSDIHPESAKNALFWIQNACENLKFSEWNLPGHSEIGDAVYTAYWNLKNLISYYEYLRSQKDSEMEYVINTWESQKYFEGVRDSIKDFHEKDEGNQARINYRNLTEQLGKTLAEDSFKEIFKKDLYALTGKKWYRSRKFRSYEVKRRSILSLLDLCQTLDPTLTCLYPDGNQDSDLQKIWRKKCVGKDSALCKHPFEAGLLINDPEYAAYYSSLCGVGGD